MNAKRMLNIGGILNTLFSPPPLYVYLQCVFVRVCAQMISDSSHGEGGCTYSHLPGKRREEVSV